MQARALSQTADAMLTELVDDMVMPFDVGTLQNEGTFVDDRLSNKGKVQIIHDTPYARRLYYNPQYNFNQDKNPNARGEWWEDWIKGIYKKRPTKLYSQLYARLARRYVK